MRRLIPTDSGIGLPETRGREVKESTSSTGRKCASWIDSFVQHTSYTDSPAIYRKWAAIAAIGAALEQKVWLVSAGRLLHANLYVFLIGHPGVGKTRAIMEAQGYLRELRDFHIVPTSVTAARLIDVMARSKRFVARLPDPPLEYNTAAIVVEELGTFIHKYDNEMIAVLSAFYDTHPYGHERRGGDLKIKIELPQLSIICGSTPSNLLDFLPEGAWDQGFMSRVILVFSDEKIIGDDFAIKTVGLSKNLLSDLQQIHSLTGEVRVTEDYRNLVNLWRSQGEKPAPDHPKLIRYNSRRRVHLYKLSIIAAAERSNVLLLTRDDFNKAMNWLVEAEFHMPEIFNAGSAGADAKAMDQIYHYIMVAGKTVPEHKIVNYARTQVQYAHNVMRVLDVMEKAGMIEAVSIDKATGMRQWRAIPKEP